MSVLAWASSDVHLLMMRWLFDESARMGIVGCSHLLMRRELCDESARMSVVGCSRLMRRGL
jgi:hypothetical protein